MIKIVNPKKHLYLSIDGAVEFKLKPLTNEARQEVLPLTPAEDASVADQMNFVMGLLKKVIVDFAGIVDNDGEAVECYYDNAGEIDDDLLMALVQAPALQEKLIYAAMNISTGSAEDSIVNPVSGEVIEGVKFIKKKDLLHLK